MSAIVQSQVVPCNGDCMRFMSASGLPVWVSNAELEPPLQKSRIAIVACAGVGLGGAQIRCVETARAMTARNLSARCLTDCKQDTLASLAKHRYRSIIFIRNLPRTPEALSMLRRAACALLLDTLDLSPIWHRNSCSDRRLLAPLDGVIANNQVSWARIAADCPELARKPVHLIEHFHSITRRVSDGSGWPGTGSERAPRPSSAPRALLVQEHRVRGTVGFCRDIRMALPAGMHFGCHPLWGGFAAPKNREGFFRDQLNLTQEAVRSIAAQHFGVGAMFTAVYAKYDLLIQWLPSNSSAQRLSNALASGVPVIAQSSPAFAEVHGVTRGVLLARDHTELRAMSQKLQDSQALRRRVSEAGVQSAARFTADAIIAQYVRAINAAARIREARPQGGERGVAIKCPRLEISKGGKERPTQQS